ncbi:hypothetical protein AAZX31_16G019900 [Glycine max]|nr:hypothetical protein GLYMA_16G021450v4 [Glycine max]KAH1149568.1 hypothetical protein GYH30_043890 [Glycine max]
MANPIPIRPWPRLPSLEATNTSSHEKTKENETKVKGILHTNPSGYDEANGIRVITIVGENRGAEMKITQSQKKQQPIQKSDKAVRTLSSTPIMNVVYSTNSNVQCVNNSLVFNSTSCNHHNPGVLHLIIPN